MATAHLPKAAGNDVLSARLSEFRRALDDEIAVLRKGGGQKTYLSDGHYLGMRDGRAVYSFTADSELRFPDDTTVDLEYRKTKYSGIIVSIAGMDVILALSEHIGDSVATALLFTEPWFLLQKLQERLEAMREPNKANVRLATSLLGKMTLATPPDVELAGAKLKPARNYRGKAFVCNTDQLKAVSHVLANRVSFVWGPPGTGKTSTLGMTVAALVENGESVLVLAHSNVAVDVAMKSIAEQVGYSMAYASGRVLRFGPTALPELDKYPEVHVRGVVRKQNPNLIAEIDTLEGQRRRFVNRSRAEGLSDDERQQIKDEVARVKIKLAPLYEQLKVKESELVKGATVVGCTLSKASIGAEIFERQFDAVVIDEASMAYIPHCVFAAGLAKKHIAIFGDFRQLAPIAQAETAAVQRWLLRDIFDEAGITAQVNAGKEDPRMVMLHEQHRMHPDIAKIVNKLFYGGRLSNGSGVEQRAAPAVAAAPAALQPLAFYDLGPLGAHCFSDKESHSRFNPVSALIAAQLARQATQNESVKGVGIVTPYSAQARLIRRLLKDLNLPDSHVRVATVHRFQGSENHVIIFDAVDGEPQKNPGKLLQGGIDSTAMRLANVALSRAQGKFVGLFNRTYLQEHLGYTDIFLPFMRELAVHALVEAFNWTHPSPSSHFGTGLAGLTVYTNCKQAGADIERDFLSTKEEIAIYWPTALTPQHFSARALLRCDPAKVRFYVSGAGARSFPTELKNAQIMNSSSTLGIGLLGMDRKRLWMVLDPKSSASPVLRLDLPQTASLLYTFWRLVPEQDLIPSKALQMPCMQCKGPMWIAEGKYGAYLKCGNCSYTRGITSQVATQMAQISGVVCGKCGAMVRGRKGFGGVFLGCTRYPDCDWTMPIDLII